MSENNYVIYDLSEKSGWILSSFKEADDIYHSPLLQLGRTNYVNPWQDPSFHHHTSSVELYLLIKGELWHVVNNVPIKMKGSSLLVVKPGVSHSIIGGRGKIHHYGMKIPHSSDKKIYDDPPKNLDEIKDTIADLKEVKQLDSSIGFHIDFNKKENQNKWILGFGKALYETSELSLAYMNYQSDVDFQAIKHPNELHLHKNSTEWYLTIEGNQKLLVDGQEISVYSNSLLRVKKRTSHKLLYYKYPFKGVNKIVLE
jgi:mannose-6-phosphate isomerase-like protein (cupin superfamily)